MGFLGRQENRQVIRPLSHPRILYFRDDTHPRVTMSDDYTCLQRCAILFGLPTFFITILFIAASFNGKSINLAEYVNERAFGGCIHKR